MKYTVICIDCGKKVEKTGHRQDRCPACAEEANRVRSRERYYGIDYLEKRVEALELEIAKVKAQLIAR